MSENLQDVTVREQADFQFHDAIIRAARNRVLLQLARTLEPLLIKSRQITGKTHRDMPRIVRRLFKNRNSWSINASTFAERAASTMRFACSALSAIGFSQSTALRCSIAASVISM